MPNYNPAPKKSHKEWIHNIMTDEQYQEEWQPTVQTTVNGGIIVHPDQYKSEYDQIAYDVMSKEDATLTHVLVALHCSKPTLHNWIKRHPTLRSALIAGQAIGEVAFRDKLKTYAFQPTGQVNNGLIKMIAKNVHNIDADETTVLIETKEKKETDYGIEESARLYADVMGRGETDVIEITYEDVTEADVVESAE